MCGRWSLNQLVMLTHKLKWNGREPATNRGLGQAARGARTARQNS